MPRRSQVYGLRAIVEIPLLFLVAFTMAVGIRVYLGQPFVIPSESMVPQLEVGDRVLVSKLSYDFHDINRGDVLVFEGLDDAPPDRSLWPWRLMKRTLETFGIVQPRTEDFIKRVIGLPGEVVEAKNGRVFIDGKELVEPYLPPGVVTSTFGPHVVPDDHVFVLGDNRPNSADSRFVGPIPTEKIVGRAFLRVWPPGRWAFL